MDGVKVQPRDGGFFVLWTPPLLLLSTRVEAPMTDHLRGSTLDMKKYKVVQMLSM